MPEYNITQADLDDADNFLTQFMTEVVPDADYGEGSSVRDILIKGFSYLYAYLRGEVDRVAVRQSLFRIQDELTDEDDISEAVQEILSNWFLTPKDGNRSTVTVLMHFTEKETVTIPSDTQFWKTPDLQFVLDTDNVNYVIPGNQLLPTFNSQGVLMDYVGQVPLIAQESSSGLNVPIGRFYKVIAAGGIPFFAYAENIVEGSGGTDDETPLELAERAETSITVRNLVNNRSCDTTLREEFPGVLNTLTIGMGEPEMVRDIVPELGANLRLHAGGKYDTYVGMPLTTVEENLTVGGFFPIPDGSITVFRDPELTHDLGTTFQDLFIQPGYVLYLRSGIMEAPRAYPIINVSAHELHVSKNAPFPEATDEFTDASENAVAYSIGWTSPDFADIEFTAGVTVRTAAASTNPTYSGIPWGTSRRFSQPGKVVLSGQPVQSVEWVELTDPPGTLSSIIDPTTRTIVFRERVNNPPEPPALFYLTQYQLSVTNPLEAQSIRANNVITVGYEPTTDIFDTYNLRVRYQTLLGFSGVDTYAQDRAVRIAAADHLIRGRFSVWIGFTIPYRLKPISTGLLDDDEAATLLADYINTFDFTDDLDASDLSTVLRVNYDVIGAVYPFTITYTFESPDGQQVFFETTDVVSIFETDDNGVTFDAVSSDLMVPQQLQERGITEITTREQLNEYFAFLGVSDRTVVYRTEAEAIGFTRRT